MNATRTRYVILAALICLVAQGCSFESEEEKQARSELASAGSAAAEENFDLAMQHVNKSLSLHALSNAYGLRAILHMKRQDLDAAAADIKHGFELDPDNAQLFHNCSNSNTNWATPTVPQLFQLEHQLGNMKRMASIQKLMQSPSLSDVYDKVQESERGARESLRTN